MTETLIGYARYATDRQDLTAQRQELAGLGVASERMCQRRGETSRFRRHLNTPYCSPLAREYLLGGHGFRRAVPRPATCVSTHEAPAVARHCALPTRRLVPTVATSGQPFPAAIRAHLRMM